jgi:hypothetical protein
MLVVRTSDVGKYLLLLIVVKDELDFKRLLYYIVTSQQHTYNH